MNGVNLELGPAISWVNEDKEMKLKGMNECFFNAMILHCKAILGRE